MPKKVVHDDEYITEQSINVIWHVFTISMTHHDISIDLFCIFKFSIIVNMNVPSHVLL